ncbi:MAG: chorismate mutase [Anaeromyxobacteraceae bacterium]|nr:chorismate mutase [Anaeromyxobacteraceae bacterium]
MRGIRGATQISANTVEAMEEAVVEMVDALMARNRLRPEDITWAIFTVTHDLDADFPARAARLAGWHQVPMICSREIPVPGSMARVVRVLLHVDSGGATHHVYLRGAQALRPDLHHGVPFQERVDPRQAAAAEAPARGKGRSRAGGAAKARTGTRRAAAAKKGRGSAR